MSSKGAVMRMDLERMSSISSLANGNDLAAWFGFCCVYLTIVGFETKRAAVRVASWLAAAGCLYVVGLTVGRGALFAAAIAILVALRRLLKRGFVPVIVLIILSWITYELELFKPIVASYAARGMEETGRLTVWPLVIKRFLSSPLAGVGVSNIGTRVPSGKVVTPHNSFLFLALASGVVPLVFFLGYWVRTARGVLATNIEQMPDAPFRIPLFIYVFLIAQQLNSSFMSHWTIVTLCVVSCAPHRLRRMKRWDTEKREERPASLAVVPFR
jgi:O-antigen ligase